VRYLPPFEVVRRSLGVFTIKDEVCVSTTYADFVRMIKLFLTGIDVDEKWYLEQYPDIREAIEAGRIESAKRHFVNDGYFEGRLPFPLSVDEPSYLARYPDVAAGISNGKTPSALQHYVDNGYREGRIPLDL